MKEKFRVLTCIDTENFIVVKEFKKEEDALEFCRQHNSSNSQHVYFYEGFV